MTIFDTFYQAANPQKAIAMEAYMRNQFKFLGITAPERKILTRDFFKTIDRATIDWEFVQQCWEKDEREFQYLAIAYLTKVKQRLTVEDIPRLRQLIVTKSWWDTIDSLDKLVGYVALHHPTVEATLLDWSTDDNIWLRRVAIDHQILRKEQTNPVLLEKIICHNFGQKEFFINKAIGWSLRDYSKTNPEWVKAFIARHQDQMAPLSIREASKYI
ncbi:DNA alkylation repair protein [Enterococcus aquimarinus]|uniref:DNA-7-methylguanine glycosylase n=1 Tax=Enterococcus aquimarinus TaxID=328396 RepID=A0A1L8QSW2_9ENTE|nr:DNA alkylation repair protein [Enterococcus aquimarinus]OJG10536.1 DNA-7-methylguanine glycosylase [Enterococcus aquimarinus]